MTIPEAYRRADIGKMAQAVVTPPVAASVPTPGASMEEWEGLIDFITRFMGQFERVMGIIQGVNGHQADDANPSGSQTVSDAPADPAPTLTVMPTIPPIFIYQKLLGYLAKAPPETTAAELLEMAKEHKDVVLEQIKEAIAEVTANVRA